MCLCGKIVSCVKIFMIFMERNLTDQNEKNYPIPFNNYFSI